MLLDYSNHFKKPCCSNSVYHYTLTGLFEKRFNELGTTIKTYKELNQKLLKEGKELDEGLSKLEEQKKQFDSEREQWKHELDRARNEIVEQNDRLTVLSQQLAGTKVPYIHV